MSEIDTAEPSDIVHWVDGATLTGSPTGWSDVTNPATGRVTGRVALASEADAAHVIASAARASRQWGSTSLARRTQVLFAFRELLNSRKGDLATIITAEHGKVHSDAMGEIARGLEVVEFACGISHLLKGGHSEEASTGIDVHSKRVPLGVVGIISPFNFPAMVPMWFFPIAIAAGNAVVLKPSEKDPSAANWIAALWQEAGLPDGVFNVLHGDKTAVDALLTSPDVQAISFVGSTPIAEYVYETASRHGKRVQALGGAKNHMVVLPDADIEMAADAAVSAVYGSSGERCMAVATVVAVGGVADPLVEAIAARIPDVVVGPGDDPASMMGPLITAEHRDRVRAYVEGAAGEGARVVVDGSSAVPGAGFFLGPSLLDEVEPGMRVYDDEIFGPVLGVVRVATFDEALALVDANPYGNGVAVFTRDGGAARQFERKVRVGMVGINVPIPVPVAAHSFGGWKASIFGDHPIYGPEGIRFYTRPKVVTSRWPDPASSVIDLGFPHGG